MSRPHQPSSRHEVARKPPKERIGWQDRCLLLYMYWSRSTRVDALWIGTDESRKAATIFRRVEQALQLIRDHDPLRYKRILNDLDRIWITLVPGATGLYKASIRTCFIAENVVVDEAMSIEYIAAIVVHEATHARISSFGYAEELRKRVEDICVGREAAFLRKLPNGAQELSKTKTIFALPNEHYSDSEFLERKIIEANKIFNQMGVPNWILRMALRVSLIATTVFRGADHPNAVLAAELLARLHQEQGRLALARSGFEQALARCEKTVGSEHFETARTAHSLGIVLQAQGDMAGARALLERSLSIREKAFGLTHFDTVNSLNDLCRLVLAAGELEGERPLFERAVAANEKLFGPAHPYTAWSLSLLGNLLCQQGDLDAARPLFERSLAIVETSDRSNEANVSAYIRNLGILAQKQGHLGEARTLFERAVTLTERTLGREHPDLAVGLDDLACVLRDQGDIEIARRLFERALAICEKAYGPEDSSTKAVRDRLEGVLKQIGDAGNAEASSGRTVAISEKADGHCAG